MQKLIIGFVTAVALNASLAAQSIPYGVTRIDSSGTSFPHPNITSAVAAVTGVGEQILVQGAKNASGQVMAYADDPAASSEDFPIDLTHAQGLVIKPADSNQVAIHSVAGDDVFTLGGVASPAKIAMLDLGIAGATNAIRIQTAGGAAEMTLSGVDFGRNKHCVSAIANGGTISVEIVDAKVGNLASYPGPVPPSSAKFTAAFRFHGMPGIGVVSAHLDRAKTFGNFPASIMDPEGHPYPGVSRPTDNHDLDDFATEFTRFVEVYAGAGPIAEHGAGGPNPIPEVDLRITGGTWDGGADEGGGWGVGVYAFASGATAIAGDYFCGFDVAISGLVIRDFRGDGVYAESQSETRGRLDVSGQTVIRNCGIQDAGSHSLGQSAQSGIRAVAFEGYLGLTASECLIRDNTGYGIYAYSPITQAGDGPYPMGLYVGLQDCKVFRNLSSGIGLDAAWRKSGTSYTTPETSQRAVVGAAVDHWQPNGLPGGSSLWETGAEPLSGALPFGQGFIDRCAISNNGEYGILARARGMGPGWETIVAARITNCFVWNHTRGGYRAELFVESPIGTPALPWLLTPIVHSTFVENDTSGTGNNSIEVNPSPVFGIGRYVWNEAVLPLGSTMEIDTEIMNGLLHRGGGASQDFGPNLKGFIAVDDQGPGFPTVPANRVGVAGMRMVDTVGSMTVPYPWSTRSMAPFSGGPPSSASLAGSLPNPFFLASGPAAFYPGPAYLMNSIPTVSNEVLFDYSLKPRDILSLTTWEKGGDEL